MGEPIVSFLVETIGHLLVEEGKFLSGVRDEAEQLHSDLKMMRALLKDADEKQHEAALVKEWVSQSKDVAYEAENMLEDYAFNLASRGSEKGILAVVKRYACILNECYIRHKVGLEIQNLNTRVSNLTRQFQEYGIRAVTEREGSSSRQQQLRMTYSHVADDEDFVGFGRDVEELVEALVKEEDFFGHYGVVSISGIGGSGKTTLARKVYNDPIVKSHFDSFAWVCISQQWQARNLLQGILVSFLPERRQEVENWSADEIVGELLRVQQDTKCLVVLDDVWSTDTWECIRDAFPIRKKGNKILLTTRNKDVAIHVGPHGYHHEPRMLNDDEGWELLQKKALKHGSNTEDIQNLQVLGKEMVKVCRGLPLAVVVLGGILATKHSSTEWEGVHKKIKSYLGKGQRMEQNQGEVQRILALSYSDLPYKLKPCFLYLSLFPEDERIKAKSMYALWIAEGMVLAEDRLGNESMIEMADRYLGELAKRCLVTVQESGVYTHGRYYGCSLHDLLRDLCKAKAREEKFLECLDYGRGNHIELANSVSSSAASCIPRIMISLSEQDAAKHSSIQLQQGSKHFRTLVFSATEGNTDLIAQILAESRINRFKMLRSLVLENVITQGTENDKNPKCVHKLPVGKLIHLRLLRLRESVLMMSPSSISNLEHLEILDLRYSTIRWTKKVPIKTRRLRHLDLFGAKSNSPMEIYIVDPNHVEVIYGLPSRSFYVRNLSELTNVRDLGRIDIDDEAKGVEEIFKCISKSHHLKHAHIWDNNQVLSQGGGTALVAQLFRSDVENIYLDGALGKLPEYDFHFLINLLSLHLEWSHLEDDPMKKLEKLPKLQRLEFFKEAFVRKEMVCHSWGFPQLRFLSFNGLDNFETWTVEKGAMPNLSHLQIIDCFDLRMIPDELGFVTSLKELEFGDMSDEFLERNINKFRHVPSIVVNGSKYVFP